MVKLTAFQIEEGVVRNDVLESFLTYVNEYFNDLVDSTRDENGNWKSEQTKIMWTMYSRAHRHGWVMGYREGRESN